MIIDNNPEFLNVFAKLLEIKGFRVTANIAFQVGLKHLENKSYDVVFVDTPLNGYTEKQILASLTKEHVFKKSNVFLFSSVDFDDDELDEWKKEGLYSYLKKPVKRSTMINALDNIRDKIYASQISLETESEPDGEDATPEQLKKLDLLQKQILELESQNQTVPQTESEPDGEENQTVPQTESEPDGEENQTVPQTESEPDGEENQTVPQTESEPDGEDATPEQLKKLDLLQKQILELESALYSLNQKNLSYEKSIPVEHESITNIDVFKNIIDDLKSLQSEFEPVGHDVGESFVKTDFEQSKLIKKKLEETLSELSKLKHEIQFIDKARDLELKSVNDSLIDKKKPKAAKNSSRTGVKKPKAAKNSSRTGVKKPKAAKNSSRTGVKISSQAKKY